MEPILSVKDLSVSFNAFAGTVHAVRDVSFDLMKGETLAIVGESGSGKSVTIKAILGILAKNGHIDSGSIMYQGEDMAKYKEKDFYKIRGKTNFSGIPGSAVCPESNHEDRETDYRGISFKWFYREIKGKAESNRADGGSRNSQCSRAL